MKGLVLASILGSAAAAYTVPVLAGPIHMQVTKPFSMYGVLPVGTTTPSVTLGVVPMDFVLTDLIIGNGYAEGVLVTVNGSAVMPAAGILTPQGASINARSVSTRLESGIPIPRGGTIAVQGSAIGLAVPITISGYLQ